MIFSLSVFITIFLLQWFWSGLGITLCYHRALTHRALIMPKWLEYFFVIGAYLAFQGSPIEWAGAHRIHHAYSDTKKDAHSPVIYGFWQSFIGWIYQTEKYMTGTDVRKAVPWLAKDKVYQWMGNEVLNSRPYRMFTITLLHTILIGYLFGVWAGIACGLAKFAVFFSPLFLNSFCHMNIGYRNFETKDNSRNVWWVALLTLGEGWHSNHHYRPRRCSHQVKWWEFDATNLAVKVLEKLGLAKDIVN